MQKEKVVERPHLEDEGNSSEFTTEKEFNTTVNAEGLLYRHIEGILFDIKQGGTGEHEVENLLSLLIPEIREELKTELRKIDKWIEDATRGTQRVGNVKDAVDTFFQEKRKAAKETATYFFDPELNEIKDLNFVFEWVKRETSSDFKQDLFSKTAHERQYKQQNLKRKTVLPEFNEITAEKVKYMVRGDTLFEAKHSPHINVSNDYTKKVITTKWCEIGRLDVKETKYDKLNTGDKRATIMRDRSRKIVEAVVMVLHKHGLYLKQGAAVAKGGY